MVSPLHARQGGTDQSECRIGSYGLAAVKSHKKTFSMSRRFTGRSRYWIFTLNNPVAGDQATLLGSVTGGAGNRVFATYIIFQSERGTEGTLHYQGYLEMSSPRTFSAIKNYLGLDRIHLEPRMGSQEQAIAYCSKQTTRQDGPWEAGEKFTSKAGRVKSRAVAAVIDGAMMSEIAINHPEAFVKSHQGLKALQEELAEERSWKMEVIVLYGKTGCGKTRTATDKYPNAYWVPWPAGSRNWWWPLYEGQHTVILDEFRHQVSMDKMLMILDRRPMMIQYKGGHHKFRSKRIVITTNVPPHKWYPKIADVSMLRRRLIEYAKIYKVSCVRSESTNEITEITWTERDLKRRPDRSEIQGETLDFSISGRRSHREQQFD